MILLSAQQNIATDANAVELGLYLISSLLSIVIILIVFTAKNALKQLKQLNDNFNLSQMTAAANGKRLDRAELDIDEQKKKLQDVSSTVERHSERFAMLKAHYEGGGRA